MSQKKNVLVIGGSGFIGSHLVDELISKKYKVSVLDIKKSKYHNKNAKFIKCSIQNYTYLSKIIKKNKIIYHLAGISDLNKAYSDALGTAQLNFFTTIKILNYCVLYNVEKFIFSSSIYVNSTFGGFYKASKVACESYIQEFSKIHKLDYRILRYGSIYGSRADISNGIYSILHNGKIQNKLVYKGSNKSVRRYIHVKDVAKISVRLLANKYKNKFINITGDYDIKIDDLLKMISNITKIKKIEYSEDKYLGHYVKSPFNIKKIKAINLKQKNKIKIKEGLTELIREVYEL